MLPFLIEEAAIIIWGGNNLQKWLRQRETRHALHYMVNETRILRRINGEIATSDGQIEVLEPRENWLTYSTELYKLLLGAIKLHKTEVMASLFGYGVRLYYEKQFQMAEDVWIKATEGQGDVFSTWSNLGVVLAEQKKYSEAEAAYRKAIELNPSDATAYSNLGNLLCDENLKRYDEAEAAYRKAIELNPSYATAYSNLMILLRIMGKEKEALPILNKMVEINPEDFNAYLGIASIKKTLDEPIEPSFVGKARQYIPEDDFYNRACLESVCDQLDMAFEYLQKASQRERFNPKWAWEDPDLQWIRSDPRFVEIVGPNPEKQ